MIGSTCVWGGRDAGDAAVVGLGMSGVYWANNGLVVVVGLGMLEMLPCRVVFLLYALMEVVRLTWVSVVLFCSGGRGSCSLSGVCVAL